MDLFRANVAKLVDALDLGSSGVTLGSSSLPIRTSQTAKLPKTCVSGPPGPVVWQMPFPFSTENIV
jgi:hypothetical protein